MDILFTKWIHNAILMLKTSNNNHPYINYCYPQYRSRKIFTATSIILHYAQYI